MIKAISVLYRYLISANEMKSVITPKIGDKNFIIKALDVIS